MNFQDWNEVKWDKRNEKTKTKINNAFRNGNIITTTKTGPINKTGFNIVLESVKCETETFKHKKISLTMGKKIAQIRNEKKITQKEFANAICVPLKIIQEYESSKAIPNHIIINKMEKFLGCKLRE
jgi:putative transcription factor